MRKELISLLTLTALAAASASGDTITATFNYAAGDLAITDREGGGDTYQFIAMKGEAEITTPGAPALPVVKAALIVPWGSSVNGIALK